MTPALDTVVLLVGGALLDAAWQVSVAGLALLVIERLMPRAPSRWRAALLTVAVLRFAWPASLGLPAGLPGGLPTPLPSAASAAAGPWSWLAAAAVLVWALGFTVRAAALIASWVRLAARLVPLPGDAPEARRVRALARRVGLARAPSLASMPGAGTPFVFDARRPVIVLPERQIEPGEVRLALLHELAHLRRGDLLVREVAAWIGALWWWNPVVALLIRRLFEVQEEACDDLAIAAAGALPERYGRMIVREAHAWRRAIATGAIPGRAVAGLGGASLERRLRRLLGPRACTLRLTAVHWILLILATIALLPRAASPSWRVVHAPAHEAGSNAPGLRRDVADATGAQHGTSHRQGHARSHPSAH